MTTRIRSWSTRHLYFAGRVVLINSVLSAIHSYWCQILKLPKKVINEIESICRAFLWKGQYMMQGAGLVAWENVCQLKIAGGTGIKRMAEWNTAALFKYVWAVANKEDNLWVKWRHMATYFSGVRSQQAVYNMLKSGYLGEPDPVTYRSYSNGYTRQKSASLERMFLQQLLPI
uniref:Uncharacterized protein n=1 Tax=Cannabis sativa TaxID=3483 RepID=A0A803PZ58_CANSA